jgi:hypothetical protein
MTANDTHGPAVKGAAEAGRLVAVSRYLPIEGRNHIAGYKNPLAMVGKLDVLIEVFTHRNRLRF